MTAGARRGAHGRGGSRRFWAVTTGLIISAAVVVGCGTSADQTGPTASSRTADDGGVLHEVRVSVRSDDPTAALIDLERRLDRLGELTKEKTTDDRAELTVRSARATPDAVRALLSGGPAQTRPVLSSAPGTCAATDDDPDPAEPMTACDDDTRYELGPAILQADDVKSASVQQTVAGQWVVVVDYAAAGHQTWADYTANHIGDATAVVADGSVVSAATINSVIIGTTEISGGDLTRSDAERLAAALSATGAEYDDIRVE